MTIYVNGEEKNIPESFTVADYVSSEGFLLTRIAVEINGDIIPKAKYNETLLHSKDVIEIVSFVGGG